jgi:uncharacterized protein (UPF0212 family)
MKELKELEDLETMPKDLKVLAFLRLIEKAMDKAHLTWKDIAVQLEGQECPICKSRIRKCLNCNSVVSVGTRKCLHCGFSLEKVEIEPSKG